MEWIQKSCINKFLYRITIHSIIALVMYVWQDATLYKLHCFLFPKPSCPNLECHYFHSTKTHNILHEKFVVCVTFSTLLVVSLTTLVLIAVPRRISDLFNDSPFVSNDSRSNIGMALFSNFSITFLVTLQTCIISVEVAISIFVLVLNILNYIEMHIICLTY